ncbi:MAG: hypothetical protein ACJ74O_12045 [Frankiaceae bacterium]
MATYLRINEAGEFFRVTNKDYERCVTELADAMSADNRLVRLTSTEEGPAEQVTRLVRGTAIWHAWVREAEPGDMRLMVSGDPRSLDPTPVVLRVD